MKDGTYPPMQMEITEYSETSAYKIQTPGITHKKAYDIQNKAKVKSSVDTLLREPLYMLECVHVHVCVCVSQGTCEVIVCNFLAGK
jgi:hypothetical protein